MKTISHSQMDSWQKCRVKWNYRYEANIELPTQSPPLASGKAIHTVLEAALAGDLGDEPIACAADDIIRIVSSKAEKRAVLRPLRRRAAAPMRLDAHGFQGCDDRLVCCDVEGFASGSESVPRRQADGIRQLVIMEDRPAAGQPSD